jgi:hypothetical protein
MIGVALFADLPFGDIVAGEITGPAWDVQCPTLGIWSVNGAASDNWIYPLKPSSGWVEIPANELPIRDCK